MTYVWIILGCMLVYWIAGIIIDNVWNSLIEGTMYLLRFLIILAIPGTLLVACNQSEWYQRQEKAQRAEDARQAQPHVIREADGCKVYAWKGGERWHYFTRCPATTVTESSYTTSCGKNCTKTHVETVPTNNH